MKAYILTIALLGAVGVSQAQEKKKGLENDKNRLVFTLPTKNHLGHGNQLESVTLTIRADTVAALAVRYRDPDVDTEVDSLDGVQQKGGIQTPFIPDLRIKNIQTRRNQSGKYSIDQVQLFRDSTVYFYQLK